MSGRFVTNNIPLTDASQLFITSSFYFLKKRTVLIIEDDLDIQNFISRVLELEGYRVIKASNGQTGLEMINKNPVLRQSGFQIAIS